MADTTEVGEEAYQSHAARECDEGGKGQDDKVQELNHKGNLYSISATSTHGSSNKADNTGLITGIKGHFGSVKLTH